MRKGKFWRILLLAFILSSSWLFFGWPVIWQNPPIPPKIEEARADNINILPNAKHVNDNTTELIGEITADDTAIDPDALSKVTAGDGCYTTDKDAIMQMDTFNVTSIPDGSTITAAVLHLQYGAEDGYNGTNYVRYDNGGGLTNTTIQPTDITGWSADLTYDLYAQGVDTKSELQNVDIEFTNNDGVPSDAIHFDYVWITVTYTPPIVSVSVTDGGVVYGIVGKGTSKDTTSGGLNDTQTATNDGNVAENFNIMGQGSASWTLEATAGSEQYVHEFCKTGSGSPDPCDASPIWTVLTTGYQTLATGIAVSGTQRFDLRITLPTDTSSTSEQSVDITIQAVAQ